MVPILVCCIRFGVLLTGRVCTVESCILISEQGSGIFIQYSSHLFVLKVLWREFLLSSLANLFEYFDIS
jgi:hypothetical protein